MASVNINRNVDDLYYRYKMPKLVAKVEGKGNGIKTVIVNMVEIAKSLNRPPMCMLIRKKIFIFNSFFNRSNKILWLCTWCSSQL